MPFISSREAIKVYFIHESPFIKYTFFASLDDMNGIFIQKISVSSLGSYYLIFVGGFLKKIVRTGLCNKKNPGLITRRKKRSGPGLLKQRKRRIEIKFVV